MNGKTFRIGLDEAGNGRSDWERVGRLDDAAIDAAIASDPDSYALNRTDLSHAGSSYRFTVWQDKSGNWRWTLSSKDGQVLAVSAESHATKDAATDSIANLRGAVLGARLAA